MISLHHVVTKFRLLKTPLIKYSLKRREKSTWMEMNNSFGSNQIDQSSIFLFIIQYHVVSWITLAIKLHYKRKLISFMLRLHIHSNPKLINHFRRNHIHSIYEVLSTNSNIHWFVMTLEYIERTLSFQINVTYKKYIWICNIAFASVSFSFFSCEFNVTNIDVLRDRNSLI